MRDPKKMTYDAMSNEVSRNRSEMETASRERKRELINRNHDLMTEMDWRWELSERKWRTAK